MAPICTLFLYLHFQAQATNQAITPLAETLVYTHDCSKSHHLLDAPVLRFVVPSAVHEQDDVFILLAVCFRFSTFVLLNSTPGDPAKSQTDKFHADGFHTTLAMVVSYGAVFTLIPVAFSY